mmetsp:Transcript_10776/g.26361  ORF Transcript_10776/g.26361 Transcript_10776/m.26361 type:complete len:100 (+) Transcript_10776:371-670(+)
MESFFGCIASRISDKVFPFVSGTYFTEKIVAKKVTIANGRNVKLPSAPFIAGNMSPTIKLAIQLTAEHAPIAVARSTPPNSSAVIAQGIGPRPNSKKIT